jgi:ornithine decarboxylase
MQDRAAGRKMWADCVKMGIEARKSIFRNCKLFRPFVPPVVNGKPWQDHDTEEIANNIDFFKFIPGEKWHSFEGYGEEQYFVDPNKLMLTTPGIDVETGEYEDFGIPATILANYLRDNRIIPEKNDFNSILFLMTPAETKPKLDSLIAQMKRFEKLVEENASVSRVIPYLYGANQDRYRGVGIRDLCQEMHDFYKERNAKEYQRRLFREATFPEVAMSPYEAGKEMIRNHVKLMPLDELEGQVAMEGALPYPPGIFCVAPDERWSKDAVEYFKILEEGINRIPGFAPEIHGVYMMKENGRTKTYAYVWDPEA